MGRADVSRVKLADQDCQRWASLMGVVWQTLLLPLALLKDGLPNSPRLRNRYEWSEQIGQEGDWVGTALDVLRIPLMTRPEQILRSKSSDAEQRVHTLFTAIFNGQETWYKTIPGLVEEVQYVRMSHLVQVPNTKLDADD